MPKLKQSPNDLRKRAALGEIQKLMTKYDIDYRQLCAAARFGRGAWYARKKDPGEFTLNELWGMGKHLNMEVIIREKQA